MSSCLDDDRNSLLNMQTSPNADHVTTPVSERPKKRAKLRGRGSSRLRIIAINDVYNFVNFSRLKTLVDREKQDPNVDFVLVTCAGDFLAPSLLSSLDHGKAAVEMLNAIPVDMVCFGNHEDDVPGTALKHRLEEFGGIWLNSNMPLCDAPLFSGCEALLPKSFILNVPIRSTTTSTASSKANIGNKTPIRRPTLQSKAKTRVPASAQNGTCRKVAFLGLCIGGAGFAEMYRQGAFEDIAREIEPVLEAAPKLVQKLWQQHPDIDAIVPLTHQDMAEDVALAKTGMFPVEIKRNCTRTRQSFLFPKKAPPPRPKRNRKEILLYVHFLFIMILHR